MQCAPGADFRPVLAMVDRVLAARKGVDAARAAAAKAAPGKPAAGQPRPGHLQQPQQKVGGACGQVCAQTGSSMCLPSVCMC
jgi:hypothetical protein